MRTIKLASLLLLSVAGLILIVQNTAAVQARFLWMNAEVPVILLLILTAAGGFVCGLLAALMLRGKPES